VPFAVALGAGVLCLVLVPTQGSRLQLLMVLTGTLLFVAGATVLATPVTREALIAYFPIVESASYEDFLRPFDQCQETYFT
jgi:hypothetical protein